MVFYLFWYAGIAGILGPTGGGVNESCAVTSVSNHGFKCKDSSLPPGTQNDNRLKVRRSLAIIILNDCHQHHD